MDNRNLRSFELLQKAFDFEPDDLIKIHTHLCAGHELISAGISTWHLIAGKLSRHTEQLRIPGLCLILDDTFLYQELMADLHCLQENLIAEGNKPESLDRVLYLYTKHKNNIKLHLFTRVAVDKPVDGLV